MEMLIQHSRVELYNLHFKQVTGIIRMEIVYSMIKYNAVMCGKKVKSTF